MACDIDIAIIGAGVIGLAVAYQVSEEGRSVIIFEKNEAFGRETSSRNSGVIHTSILNPRGSGNASLCYEGSMLLYEFAQKYKIDHCKTGKLLVAVEEKEVSALEVLYLRKTEGLNMQLLTREDMKKLEPEVSGKAGLLLPDTGVIDTYRLMQGYLGLACLKGSQIALKSEVVGLEKTQEGYLVKIKEDSGITELKSRTVINCAGLYSDKIAALAGIDILRAGYKLYYFKGEFYSIKPEKARSIGRRLIYPMNDPRGLVRIHTVLDVDGRVRLGPHFYPYEGLDYSIDDSRKQLFYEQSCRLFPHLKYEDIEPESTGISPRTYAPDQPFKDFIIHHEVDRGLAGLINLVGIESPGLTASLAIGRHVGKIVDEVLG